MYVCMVMQWNFHVRPPLVLATTSRPPPISDDLSRSPHILLLLYIQYLYWMRDNFKLKSKCHWYMWTYLVCILSRHWRLYRGVWTLQATQDQKHRSRSLKWKKVELKATDRDRERERISTVEVVNWSVKSKKWHYQFIVFGIRRQLMKFVYTPRKEIVYQVPVEIQIEVWSLVLECGRQKGLRDQRR